MTFSIEFTRGDNRSLTISDPAGPTVPFKDINGNPYDWTGSKLWFTAKRSVDIADADATIHKTSDPGGGITFESPGIAKVSIDKADTETLQNRSTRLLCDVQLLTAAGDVYTIDSGSITVGQEVTLATS